jgi:cell division protein FtsL
MDSGKNTFTVVNKVLVVSIIAVALAIVGVIFTDTNFGATASNIAGVFGSATGSVAGVSTSSNNTSEIISPEKLEEEISQSTDLPADDPQILRVQNPDSFRSRFPVLYRDLQEGDMILIYETKTIVYRPSISKFLAIIPR